MAGTAPTETSYLFVEDPGPWGRQAVTESRLPAEVRDHLAGLAGVRVQLVRRPGGPRDPGTWVIAATLADELAPVRSVRLDDVRELLDLTPDDLVPHPGPLWLVCTNGRRDRCCAEAGRPVAAALADRWPEATWETTHLGGHRFAATLLALPSGITLGRLSTASALDACRDLERGLHPPDHVRGRAGRPGAAQVAELHLRRELGLHRLTDVVVERTGGAVVRLRARGQEYDVHVREEVGEPRPQSCGGTPAKAAAVYEVTAWGTSGGVTR